jgi:hypothetical protein
MISSALYRFFGMVQISSSGFLPLSIWTRKLRLGQGQDVHAAVLRLPGVNRAVGKAVFSG